MITRMEKDVAFVAEQRKNRRKAIVAELSSQLFDDLFSGDSLRHKAAQKKLRRARGKIVKVVRELEKLKAEDARIVEVLCCVV